MTRAGRAPAAALLALTLAAVALVGAALWDTWFGDPVIYLPYARNLADGDPFAFNPGEFSSGTTSPLWALLLGVLFLPGTVVGAAKALALAVVLAALAATAWAAASVTRSWPGAAIGTLFVAGPLALPGLMLYESALAVALVAASLPALVAAARGGPGRRPLVALAAIWAALPLVRPDATVLVVVQVLVLWRAGVGIRPLALAALAAAVPSAAYYGYSWITLGTPSVSSQARAFSLEQEADEIGPLTLSLDAVRHLLSVAWVFALAAGGLLALRGAPALRRFGLAALVAYPLIVVFVSPVTADVARYLLPIAPVLAAGVAAAAAWAQEHVEGVALTALAGAAVLVFGVVTLDDLRDAAEFRHAGYGFDEIVERQGVARVNGLARPGDEVLAYEVQDRWLLRDDLDVLSLDGVTDGKAVPYLRSRDVAGFLRRYRPAFWLANDAVTTREPFDSSLLASALRRAPTLRPGEEVRLEGIGFRLVARRREPPPEGFAGWRAIFALSYRL